MVGGAPAVKVWVLDLDGRSAVEGWLLENPGLQRKQ